MVACVQACVPAPIALIRIAVEETEAFFLGDLAAMKKAFGKVKSAKHKEYKQDSICGTWEIMREVLGVKPGSEDKVDWAERIGPHMTIDPSENKSPSFRVFCSGVLRIVGDDLLPSKRQRRTPR